MFKKELEMWQAKFKLWNTLNADKKITTMFRYTGRRAGCKYCINGWSAGVKMCPKRGLVLAFKDSRVYNWRLDGKDGSGICVEFIKHV